MSPHPTMTDELADVEQTFELVIPTGYDPHIVAEHDTLRSDAQLRIESDVREGLGGEPSASQSSHGYGADGNAIAVVITGLGLLFFSGKRINENIDAWLQLGRRVKPLLARLVEYLGHAKISEPLALALALETIAAKGEPMDDVRLLGRSAPQVRNSSLCSDLPITFRSYPDRYYVFTIQLGERTAYAIGIASNGTILFEHELTLDFWRYPSGSSAGDI